MEQLDVICKKKKKKRIQTQPICPSQKFTQVDHKPKHKLLEDKIEENLDDLRYDDYFLDAKSRYIKEKSDKQDFFKIKTSALQRHNQE